MRLQSGKLGLLYGRFSGTGGGTLVGYELCFRTSDDEGESWSEEVSINLSGETASNYHDVLFQLQSGRLVLPTRFCPPCRFPELRDAGAYGTFQGKRFKTEGHAHSPEIDTSQVYFSDDEGATWQRGPQDIVIWHQDGYGGMWPCDEPGAVQLRDGRLLMMFRTTLGRLYQSISDDEGLTWSLPQPTELASSYSPCRLRTIPTTGDLLCVWNQVSGDEIRRGFRRSRLSLAISTDDGGSWGHFKTLEVGGPADRSDRVAPDDEIGMVRGEKELGELPADMIYVSYPNAHFFGDEVGTALRLRPATGCFHRSTLLASPPQDCHLSDRVAGTSRYSLFDEDHLMHLGDLARPCKRYKYTPLATCAPRWSRPSQWAALALVKY